MSDSPTGGEPKSPGRCSKCGRMMVVVPDEASELICRRCMEMTTSQAALADRADVVGNEVVERMRSVVCRAFAWWTELKPKLTEHSLVVNAAIAFLVAVPTAYWTRQAAHSGQGPVVVGPQRSDKANGEPARNANVVANADPNANVQVARLEQRIVTLEQKCLELAQRKPAGAVIPLPGERDDKAGNNAAVLRVLQELADQLDEHEKQFKDHDKQLKGHAVLLLAADKNVRDALRTADKNLKDTFGLADRNVKAALKDADRNVRDALTVLTVADRNQSAEIVNQSGEIAALRRRLNTLEQQVANFRR